MIWWDGWQSNFWDVLYIKFDISSRVPSTFSRRRSPPGWPTWSWSWSCCPTTWWPRESAQRSSAITSAASSKVFSTIRYSICILTREMVKYEGTQGKEKDLEQFSEAINIIRLYTRRRIIRPSYIFLFQSDDVIWTQCPKWRWQWWSWTRRGTYRRGSRTLSSTSLIGFTSTGLVKV